LPHLPSLPPRRSSDLANYDAGLFVVQCHQVGRGQYIGIAVGLQGTGQYAQVKDFGAQDIDGAFDHAQAQALGQRIDSGHAVSSDAAAAKVGTTDKRGSAVGYAVAAGHPLNTEFGRFVGADFNDQAFYQDLGAALVQLIYDFTQAAVERW